MVGEQSDSDTDTSGIGTLQTFEAPPSPSLTTIQTDEITAVCPFDYGAGRDFYDLTIRYRPVNKCVETKSLRDWIRSLDNEEITAERLADVLYQTVVDAIDPDQCYVRLEQNIRGGLVHTEEVGDLSSASEASAAADVFQQHRDELGFVNRAQCEAKDLITVERDGRTVGAALGNHCVRKPQTTLYEIAVLPDYRRQGIGRELIRRLAADSPHERIVAKCPTGLPANQFYRSTGWLRVNRESGKNRELNVWELSLVPDVITTGKPHLTEIASEYGLLRGTRMDDLPRYDGRDVSLNFLDLHWKDPDFETLLDAARRHEPTFAVAGDYSDENPPAVINDRARKLRPHADRVIVVPKRTHEIPAVPEWAIVGYSTPTEYGGTDAPPSAYRGRPLHILGGSPAQQFNAIDALTRPTLFDDPPARIVSIDGNSIHNMATSKKKYYRGSDKGPDWSWIENPVRSEDNERIAYERSVINWTYRLRQEGYYAC